MAGKITADFDFLKVTGEPSLIHRIFFDFLPFWQGSTQRFKLIIEAKNNFNYESSFLYHIEYTNGETSLEQKLTILPFKTKEKRAYYLVPITIICTGDAVLELTEKFETHTSGYKPVYSFHVTSRSWLWLTMIAGLLAGIFAALVNFLLGLIN